MKKILIISLGAVFILTGCFESDPYADLRKMTVKDYLNNKPKMEEVLDKCFEAEIKDFEICEVAKKANNNIHTAW